MNQKLIRNPELKFFKLIPGSLKRARMFCQFAHQNQKHKGTEKPFADHPIAVERILSKYTNNIDILVAALLHDVVEDTEFTLEDIRFLFGNKVANLVDQVSEVKRSPDGKKRPWIDRKIEHLAVLRTKKGDALMIKVADHIHSLETTTENLTKKQATNSFNSSTKQRLWYSQEILQIATEKGVEPKLLQRLNQAIEDFKKKFVA